MGKSKILHSLREGGRGVSRLAVANLNVAPELKE